MPNLIPKAMSTIPMANIIENIANSSSQYNHITPTEKKNETKPHKK